jgi:hypothetical protein
VRNQVLNEKNGCFFETDFWQNGLLPVTGIWPGLDGVWVKKLSFSQFKPTPSAETPIV